LPAQLPRERRVRASPPPSPSRPRGAIPTFRASGRRSTNTVATPACDAARPLLTPEEVFRRGFSKTSLQAGTQIVVDGYRAKDGTNKMNAREITFADGRRLFAGSDGTGAPR